MFDLASAGQKQKKEEVLRTLRSNTCSLSGSKISDICGMRTYRTHIVNRVTEVVFDIQTMRGEHKINKADRDNTSMRRV